MSYQKHRPVYYIGGGTCCGKSTVAELLCQKHGFTYYKLDDDLEPFSRRMVEDGNVLAQEMLQMSADEMWLRPPEQLCHEELLHYEAMYPYAAEKVASLSASDTVVAEAAAFLPKLMKKNGIDATHYLCIVPTQGFQVEKYAQRPWIDVVLKGSSDPRRAFANWMERDVLFSTQVLADARELGYTNLVVDGSRSIEETLAFVETAFQLVEA